MYLNCGKVLPGQQLKAHIHVWISSEFHFEMGFKFKTLYRRLLVNMVFWLVRHTWKGFLASEDTFMERPNLNWQCWLNSSLTNCNLTDNSGCTLNAENVFYVCEKRTCAWIIAAWDSLSCVYKYCFYTLMREEDVTGSDETDGEGELCQCRNESFGSDDM